jgi:plastocyanin
MHPTVFRSAGSTLAAAVVALAAAVPAAAGTLEVSVVDEQGRPIERVAVYALPEHAPHGETTAVSAAPPTATMDQQKHQFVPHMLVVQTGTSVNFPNSDSVSHHVYSFSETKTFELPLYKGDVHPPVVFEKPGIVVIGCNIHDGMLGYVVVVDTPHFALTNEQGVAVIDGVPNGEYALQAWTSRVRRESLPAAEPVAVADGTAAVEIQVMGRLAPAHPHAASSLTWDRY